MIHNIDFSIAYPTKVALITCALFPFVLMIIARIPVLEGRNALQFLLSGILTTLGWLISLGMFIQGSYSNIDASSLWISFFLYTGVMLVYLEIWALLSRGYTLGLLLTFYKSKRPLSSHQLASLYRGGEGLDWLIKHRFSGLLSANMITLQNNKVILTMRGTIIAFLYKLSVCFFGLRVTG